MLLKTPRTVARIGLAGVIALVAAEAPARATPAVCVASQNESQDLLQAGKLVDSQSKLVTCAGDQTCPQMVRVDCVRSLEELRPRIPTLVFAAVAPDGSDTVDVKVYRDDALLALSLTGASVEVDPGEHKFRFVGAAGLTKETTLVVREGEKSRRVLIDFRPAPAPRPAAADAVETPPAPASTFPTGVVGWSLLAAGVVSIGVGSYFGLTAKSDNDSSKPFCGASIGASANQCFAQGTADRSDASNAATVSTIAFAAGLALAAAGTLVLVLGPHSHSGPQSSAQARSHQLAIVPALGPGGASVMGSIVW